MLWAALVKLSILVYVYKRITQRVPAGVSRWSMIRSTTYWAIKAGSPGCLFMSVVALLVVSLDVYVHDLVGRCSTGQQIFAVCMFDPILLDASNPRSDIYNLIRT